MTESNKAHLATHCLKIGPLACRRAHCLKEGEPLYDPDAGDEVHHGFEEDDDYEEPTGRHIIFPPSFCMNPDTLEELSAKLIDLGRNRQELSWPIEENWDNRARQKRTLRRSFIP